jgi:MFS family permease
MIASTAGRIATGIFRSPRSATAGVFHYRRRPANGRHAAVKGQEPRPVRPNKLRLDIIGTIALIATGVHYGGHLTAWELAPATAVIGLGQGLAMPSLIGAALSGVPRDRAGAAAGILTTMQQFGTAVGVALIGAVFYGRLGDKPSRGSSVSAIVLAMVVDVAIVLGAVHLSPGEPRSLPEGLGLAEDTE